jgi:hypothetical protein
MRTTAARSAPISPRYHTRDPHDGCYVRALTFLPQTHLELLQSDRELQDSLRLLSATPTGHYSASAPALHDPAVRQWLRTNGLPLDASGSLEM